MTRSRRTPAREARSWRAPSVVAALVIAVGSLLAVAAAGAGRLPHRTQPTNDVQASDARPDPRASGITVETPGNYAPSIAVPPVPGLPIPTIPQVPVPTGPIPLLPGTG